MDSDICECKGTKGEHDARVALLEALVRPGQEKVGGKFGGLDFDDCIDFRLDRKATWDAARGKKERRTCLLLTGCTTCGSNGAVTYHKDAQGNLRHTNCPGPRSAKPTSMDKSKMEAPR